MDKSILKGISVAATVVGAIVTVAGSLASARLQDLEIEEKVLQAIEQMSK